MQLDLCARGERLMLMPELAEAGDVAVEQAVGVEVRAGAVGRAVHLDVVQVAGHLADEHVLAGVLVSTVADEALLVAVVDHRLAAGEEHQLVGELGALLALRAVAQEEADAAHVVVAEEGGQAGGRRTSRRVVVVCREQAGEALGGEALGVVEGAGLVREIKHGVHVRGAHVGRQQPRVGVVDLAEHEEIVLGVALDGLGELLPEHKVDVLDGVDAEAVDAQIGPGLVDVDHAVDDDLVLGHQVVEVTEIHVDGRFTRRPPRVEAAVVVERRVVEPQRELGLFHALRDLRIVREGGGVGVHLRHGRVARGVIRGVELRAVDVLVGAGFLGDVGRVGALMAGVVNDIGGVVGDDVEVDLDALGVGLVDERLQLGVGAEVRVDLGEVRDPVAVVAGRRVRAGALHGTVHERRGEPDGAGAEALDVVELVAQALDVAAVEEALVCGVEAGDEAVRAGAVDGEHTVVAHVAGGDARIVGGVAVVEPVGHHEVERVAGTRVTEGGGGEGVVARGVAARQVRNVEGDLVGAVVEGELQRGVCGEAQRVVAVAHAVGLVPGAVDRDLELVAACRDGELAGPHTVAVGIGEGRGVACGLPVLRATEFGLEVTHQGDGLGCGGGRRWG